MAIFQAICRHRVGDADGTGVDGVLKECCSECRATSRTNARSSKDLLHDPPHDRTALAFALGVVGCSADTTTGSSDEANGADTESTFAFACDGNVSKLATVDLAMLRCTGKDCEHLFATQEACTEHANACLAK